MIFYKSENKGRKLFEEVLNSLNLKGNPVTDILARTDYDYYNEKGEKITAEIKVRYRDYPTWQMEVDKLLAMCKKIKEENFTDGTYVCFFGNTCYMFSLKEICMQIRAKKIIPTQTICPQKTDEATDRVWKHVIYIPKSLATVLTKNNEGKWNFVS